MKSTAPGSLSHIICLCDLFYLPFIFGSINPKTQKYFAALYFICDLLFQSITTFSRQHAISGTVAGEDPVKIVSRPRAISGSVCEVLLVVCRGCLRCVAWFSYWFDTLVS